TVIDFEVPKKYGLRQTIGDTTGIGGIFRALRTIPVMLEFARDMERLCPDAWFLNYTNPMSIVTGAMLRASNIKTVGLCHSVQVCASGLLEGLGMSTENIQWKIAGINHMAWLLEITRDGKDLYPEIKQRARERETPHNDMVRYEIMKHFGYYITESSEHLAEYLPYFIKNRYPELIERFNIPLDEYPRRCVAQIRGWETMREELVNNKDLIHERTIEYASYIMEAMETDQPFKIVANVLNTGLITNLPEKAIVEVPCLVDSSGISPCYVGDLPEQLAALNRTNINVHLLTLEAALTGKKEYIYQAALLDPHTSAELSIDDIVSLCDDLIEAHGDWLPVFK
ncbi:MAG: alpha-glucosidase/alpha-galactosidase, partial [Halanaerobiales bacterium]